MPGESRRRLTQRLTAAPFNAPLLREDALASQELRALLPAASSTQKVSNSC